jgi:hypothetical protein
MAQNSRAEKMAASRGATIQEMAFVFVLGVVALRWICIRKESDRIAQDWK